MPGNVFDQFQEPTPSAAPNVFDQFQKPSAAAVQQAPAVQKLMDAPVQPNQVGAGVHIPQHAQPSPVQTGTPGPSRFLADVAGLTPTPQAQQDFHTIGHGIDQFGHFLGSAAEEGAHSAADILRTNAGDVSATNRLEGDLGAGIHEIGSGLASGASDVLGALSEGTRGPSVHQLPSGLLKIDTDASTPLSRALSTAAATTAGYAKQDLGNTKPGPLGTIVKSAAQMVPYAALGSAADGMKAVAVYSGLAAGSAAHETRQALDKTPALVTESANYKAALRMHMSPADATQYATARAVDNAAAVAGVGTALSMALAPGVHPWADPSIQTGGMAAAAQAGVNVGTGQPLQKNTGAAALSGALAGVPFGLAAALGAHPETPAPEAPATAEAPKTPQLTGPRANPAQENADAMREMNPTLTPAQNVQAFTTRMLKAGIPQSVIDETLAANPGASALDTLKALRRASNKFMSTQETAHGNTHQGRQGPAPEVKTPGSGTVEGEPPGAGKETQHGDASTDQQGVGQAPVSAAVPEPKFPKSLGNPSPRFGTRPIQFESDVDKALYIIANPKTQSAQHDAFVKFAMDATGLPRDKLMALATRVRADVKRNAGNLTTGDEPVKMPALAMGVARMETTPRAAPVVKKLEEAGVTAPVKPDGRVVVSPDHPDAAQVVHIAANDSAESPENDRKTPTPAQAKEGNYPKGKLLFKGPEGTASTQDVPINVEHPKGAIRRSLPGAPQSFSRPITKGEYGYIPGTRAPDGEPVDVFVGPHAADPARDVYVLHQTDPAGNFDEPKVMFGYPSLKTAVDAYRSNYPQSMHKGLLQMKPRVVTMTREQFAGWIRNGDQDVPVHAMSKKPITLLRQHGPLEATFGPGTHAQALQDAVHALNERYGLKLNADVSGIGSVVRGDVPRALGPAVHRVLAKVEGHVETTHTHTGARTVLRAGRDDDAEGTATGSQAVPAAKPRAVGGNDGVPSGGEPETPAPAWLNVPHSDAPVFAQDQGRFPVQVLGVHHTAEPHQTELPVEPSQNVLANRREFKLRTGAAIPEGQGFPHEVRLTNLYDTERDPERIIDYAARAGLDKDKPMVMRAIRAAGYDGVVVRNGEGGHAIVFSNKPIPVRAAQEGETAAATPEVARKAAPRPQAATAEDLKALDALRAAQAKGDLSDAQARQLVALYAKERHTATIGNNGEALPGVLNRTAFNEMDQNGTRGKHVAYLDADRFKAVNDLMGHAAGDDLLRSIASKLVDRFGAGNVHKLGGDEFVVHHDDPAELERGIDDVNRQLKEEVAAQEGHPVQGVGLSRGIGKTADEAESRLQANKRERRIARGTIDERAEKNGPARAADHTQHATDHPVVQVPLADLKLSPDVPQFKSGADAKGVVEPLGGSFDERGTGPIQVWVRNDGSMEVVSGRHRLELAQRTPGKMHIAAQLHYEKDGFTQADAASLDAELNIRDGNGKVKDYVQYFQNPAFDGEAGRQTADARGLLARATGQRAYTISRQGTPELIAAHRADRISDEAAYKLAEAAPNDLRLQTLGMKLLQDGKSIALAQNTLRAVQTLAPSVRNGDLFGGDDSGLIDAQRMAEVATSKQRDISEDLASVTGAAKRPERAQKRGVEIKNTNLAQDIERLKQERASWDNWQTDPAKVAAIRKELGIAAPEGHENPQEAPQHATDESMDMFGAPTTKDHLDALERSKDAARNGLDQTGRTDMQSGGGDLFAGPRPEQGRIEEPTEGYSGQPTQLSLLATDPYAGHDLRPDAPDIVTKGREAFHAFVRRYGGTVVGDAIGRELVTNGTAQLLGRSVRSTDDLAALMGVYRNPTMETLHYILTDKDGRVVDEIAFSSRLPAESAPWTKGVGTFPEIASALAARARQVGAENIWLAHNHPSGNPRPSYGDLNFTTTLANALKKIPDGGDLLKGHVVIDHTMYASITPDGDSDIHALSEPHIDFTKTPARAHPLLGSPIFSPDDLAKTAIQARRDLQGQLGIVTVDVKGRTRSLLTLPEATVTSLRGPYLVRQLGRRTGAFRIFGVLPDDPSDALVKAARAMHASGLLRDVVHADGRSAVAPNAEINNFGHRTKAIRVHEDVDPYDLHRADEDHRVAPPLELRNPPEIIRPFDRERAKEMDYSARNPIVQTKVAHGLFRSALAMVDRLDAARAAAFDSAQSMFDKRSPQQNLEDIARYQKGLPISDPAVEDFFRVFKDMSDRNVEMIRAFGEGYLEQVRAHYFTNLWKDPAQAEKFLAAFQRRPLEGSKSFMEHQVFPTVLDGIKAGLEPVSTNPADIAMRHLHDQDRFIALHDFVNQLIARNIAHDRDMEKRIPAGWSSIDDPAFQRARGLQGETIVPTPIAQFINNYLSPGFSTPDAMGDFYRGFRKLQMMQLSMKLGFSLFHAGFTTFDHLATNLDVARGYFLRGQVQQGAKALADGLLSPVTAVEGLFNRGPGAKLVRQYLGTEPMDAQTEAVLGALMKGGARAYMHPTQELESLHNAIRALRQHNYGSAALKAIPATLEAVMRPVQRYLVPAQKMFARVALMKLELDRYAKALGQKEGDYAGIVEAMHPDFLTHLSSTVNDVVDDRLGQMNLDNLAMNKYLLQVLQVTTMAPTFQMGSLRVIGGPIVDLLRALPKSGKKFGIEYGPEEAVAPVKRGESVAGPQENMPFWTSRMTYLMTMVATFGLANVLGTYLMTGKGPTSRKDLFTMTDPTGTLWWLPTYMRFMYEMGTHPEQTLANKTSPTLVAMHELATNRTWDNTKIFQRGRSDGALGDVVQHLSELTHWLGSQAEPISVANQQENAEKAGGIGQDIVPFFGVTRAPSYLQRTAFQNYVSSRYIQDFDGGVRTRAQVQRARAIGLAVRQMRAGQKPDLSQLAPVDRPLVYKYAHGDPYVAMMKRLPLQQRITAYESATPAERKKLNLRAILYSGANYKQLQRMPPDERAWAQSRLREITQQER